MTAHASFDRLAACLSRLPGVGRRSAERMALALALDSADLLTEMISSLQEVRRSICCCSRCGGITSRDENPCRLCIAPNRDGEVVCVVEGAGDIPIVERSGGFHGRYHVLGGKLSPMRGESPESLRIRSLLERVEQEKFSEVILALSTDVEGDATASFITDALKGKSVKVSRLASGLPARSGIVYSDPVTLARALKGRQPG